MIVVMAATRMLEVNFPCENPAGDKEYPLWSEFEWDWHVEVQPMWTSTFGESYLIVIHEAVQHYLAGCKVIVLKHLDNTGPGDPVLLGYTRLASAHDLFVSFARATKMVDDEYSLEQGVFLWQLKGYALRRVFNFLVDHGLVSDVMSLDRQEFWENVEAIGAVHEGNEALMVKHHHDADRSDFRALLPIDYALIPVTQDADMLEGFERQINIGQFLGSSRKMSRLCNVMALLGNVDSPQQRRDKNASCFRVVKLAMERANASLKDARPGSFTPYQAGRAISKGLVMGLVENDLWPLKLSREDRVEFYECSLNFAFGTDAEVKSAFKSLYGNAMERSKFNDLERVTGNEMQGLQSFRRYSSLMEAYFPSMNAYELESIKQLNALIAGKEAISAGRYAKMSAGELTGVLLEWKQNTAQRRGSSIEKKMETNDPDLRELQPVDQLSAEGQSELEQMYTSKVWIHFEELVDSLEDKGATDLDYFEAMMTVESIVVK